MRNLSKDIANKVGEEVSLSGWVHARRDHGKLIFIDLRDVDGLTQVVFKPDNEEVYKLAEILRPEWVVEIVGEVSTRPEGMQNPDIATGKIEVKAKKLNILSEAKTPPFEITDDGKSVGEDIRMQYRYIDLRRSRMQKNLKLRHEVIKLIRDFLTNKRFLEIETPILGKSTPEGARDYLVPARLHPGSFYALPQSPQQYKQLLMVAGFERYFQIAKCFRDEDTRGDRQPEFTQLDLEMSFVEREDILSLIEELLIEIVKTVTPDKQITQIPFPRLSYKEAMEKYNSDKPDLRKDKNDSNELAFVWVLDFPVFEKETDTGKWTYSHNPFTAPKKEYEKDLLEKKNIENLVSEQYDIALNGYEIGGGGIRINKSEILKKVFEILGHSEEKIENDFGHMLQAFQYGAPPHGGIAWGLDRLIMILCNEPNLREIIAFPKTGDGRDLMMQAPSEVTEKQLKELNISVKNESASGGKVEKKEK